MARDLGYVTTLWGRKRRLPKMQLPLYEFDFSNFVVDTFDPLNFDDSFDEQTSIQYEKIDYYTNLMNKAWGRVAKEQVKQKALAEGIKIIDNGGYIADAERQCVNARVQGSASDMTKKAMILVGNDEKLKELGFKLLIPVHDELIAECPIKNAVECKKLFADLMSDAAKDRLEVPISCDVACSYQWYGEEIEVENI